MPAIETPTGRPVYLGLFQRIVNVGWDIAKQGIITVDVPLDPLDYNYVVSRWWIDVILVRTPLPDLNTGFCGYRQIAPGRDVAYSIPYDLYNGTPTRWPGGLNDGGNIPPQNKFVDAYILYGDGVPVLNSIYGGKINWFVNFIKLKRVYPSTQKVRFVVWAQWNDAYAESSSGFVTHAVSMKVYRGLTMDLISNVTQRGDLTLPNLPPPTQLLFTSKTFEQTVNYYNHYQVCTLEYDLKTKLTASA